ncbi:MAG: hypothetical protein NTW62_03030 [Candidatus Nomurabacteria bacterium]|nr:hypothetical protein [Candidatus Nomurabacteria bacterium]
MKKKILVILITFATLSACNRKEIVIQDNPNVNKKTDLTFSITDGTFIWKDNCLKKDSGSYSTEIIQKIIIYLSMQKGQDLQGEKFGFYQNDGPDYGYAKGTDHNIAFSVYGMSRHRSGVAVLLENRKTKKLTAYRFHLNGIYLEETENVTMIKRITEYSKNGENNTKVIIVSLGIGNGKFVLPNNNISLTRYYPKD